MAFLRGFKADTLLSYSKNPKQFAKKLYNNYKNLVVMTTFFWIISFSIFYFVTFKRKNNLSGHLNEMRHYTNGGTMNRGFGEEEEKTPRSSIHYMEHRYQRIEDEPGFNGAGVNIPDELKEEANRLFQLNQFNLVASDLIPPNRTLPDLRNEQCKEKVYPLESLPDTSVIIVFHNEAWSTLIRTLWSVINRTPRFLLKEIILIDDESDRDYLGDELEEYIKQLPVKISLHRMGTRSGLVRSRLQGVRIAKGKTITFLDAHCECSIGWLEPLLYQIYIDRNSVISPIIDVITDNNFEYRLVPDLSAGFDWKVLFDWIQPNDEEKFKRSQDPTQPFKTPTMAGGLLTMDREFFYEIGSYDEKMNIWGGENLEMSFRLWQCNSKVLISPCSRVGHVFRSVSPYSFPDGTDKTILVNQMRTVEVWLGDHKLFYHKSNPFAKDYDMGDISERLALKKKLKCHDFKWYLTNVFPHSQLPVHFYSVGHVKNINSSLCLHISTDGNYILGPKNCFTEVDRQVFSYTYDLQLMTMDKRCLMVMEPTVGIRPCIFPVPKNQTWYFHANGDKSLENPEKNKCLSIEVENFVASIHLNPCSGSVTEKWELEEYSESRVPQ